MSRHYSFIVFGLGCRLHRLNMVSIVILFVSIDVVEKGTALVLGGKGGVIGRKTREKVVVIMC